MYSIRFIKQTEQPIPTVAKLIRYIYIYVSLSSYLCYNQATQATLKKTREGTYKCCASASYFLLFCEQNGGDVPHFSNQRLLFITYTQVKRNCFSFGELISFTSHIKKSLTRLKQPCIKLKTRTFQTSKQSKAHDLNQHFFIHIYSFFLIWS